MLLDLLLASAHHLAVLALFAVLVGEWLLLRPGLDAGTLARLGRLDLAYGLLALAALGAGLLRVAYGLKGSAYYLGQPLFWSKLGLFLLIGLLSAVPTLRLLRWRQTWRAAGTLPSAAQVAATRPWLNAQLAGFALLPLLAAALARGLGA
jgi:putative membrane protein